MFPARNHIHNSCPILIGLSIIWSLLAAAQLWQSTKTRCPKMVFIVEIPHAGQTLTARQASEDRNCPKMCTGRRKISADDVDRSGFHLLSSPLRRLCIRKKTNLLHRGHWEKRWGVSPYNELQAQIFKQEATVEKHPHRFKTVSTLH